MSQIRFFHKIKDELQQSNKSLETLDEEITFLQNQLSRNVSGKDKTASHCRVSVNGEIAMLEKCLSMERDPL